MVKLSEKTIKTLKNDILFILHEKPFTTLFTNQIATELRRDNEFTLKLLTELKNKGYVEEAKKNHRGQEYRQRKKWKIPQQISKLLDQELL